MDENTKFNAREMDTLAGHYPQPFKDRILRRLMEAFNYLESEGLIVPAASDGSTWRVVSSKGRQINNTEEIEKYNSLKILPKDLLIASLYEKVWNDFLIGDYDSVIFKAFRELEIALREKLSSSATTAERLIVEAFGERDGKLLDPAMQPAEKQAIYKLFSGAYGHFRNTTGHRPMDYKAPEAVEVVLLVNHLLKIVAKSQLHQ